MSEQQPSSEQIRLPARKRGRRKFFSGLAIGGLVGGILATSFAAWSQGQPGPGRGCGWHGRHAAVTPEERAARADFASEWVLSRVDATEEQKARIKVIVQDALKDMTQIREQHVRNRDAFMTALSQPTVDRESLKQIRQAELQLADTASDRFVNAIADAADVLTAEQRSKLVELAQQFRRW